MLAACSSAPRRSASNSREASGTYRTAPHGLPPGLPHFVDHSVGEEEISIQAMSLVGIPYRWGGNNPQSGFDCSGLVRYVVARAADVELPRTTARMSSSGVSIEPDEVAPGDLIFFNTDGRAHSHVGIYVGNLRFVNAPSTGGTVRIDYLSNPYWARHFDGIRRVASARKRPRPFDSPTLLAAPGSSETPRAPSAAPVRSGYAAADMAPAPHVDTEPTTPPPQHDTYEPPAAAQSAQRDAYEPPVAAQPARHDTYEPPAAAQSAQHDAYEPPPPAPVARAQAAQHNAQTGGMPEQRAADAGLQPAPIIDAVPAAHPPAVTASSSASSAADDPIAKFANSGY